MFLEAQDKGVAQRQLGNICAKYSIWSENQDSQEEEAPLGLVLLV